MTPSAIRGSKPAQKHGQSLNPNEDELSHSSISSRSAIKIAHANLTIRGAVGPKRKIQDRSAIAAQMPSRFNARQF
jgi:hypothetical protein